MPSADHDLHVSIRLAADRALSGRAVELVATGPWRACRERVREREREREREKSLLTTKDSRQNDSKVGRYNACTYASSG